MFHSKEVKQQLQQAENLKTQVEAYEQLLQQVEKNVTETQMDVDQMQMSATKMDRSLTKVVDYAKDTRDDQQVMEQGLQEAVDTLRQESLQMQQLEEQCDKHTDFLQKQETALAALMEQSKHYTGYAKSLSEGSNKEIAESKRLQEQISGLEKVTGSISALALQAAIDAGRLGDSGSDFIRSAEQIRSLAEVFGARLTDTIAQTNTLQNEMAQMNTQIHQFIALLKENNQTLGKITTDVNGWNTKQQHTTSQDEQMTQLVESLLAYQGRVAEGLRRQECILEEMEKIGACYMEQQDSTSHMEQSISHMKQVFSDNA